MTTTQYTAIVHRPGHLPDNPDSNVATFDTLGEARSWLADEIERDWDAAYEAIEAARTEDQDKHNLKLAVDGAYLDAHTEVNHLQPGDSTGAGSYRYEIQTT